MYYKATTTNFHKDDLFYISQKFHLHLTSKQPRFCRVHKFLKKLNSKTLELYKSLKTDLDTILPLIESQ